MSDEPARKKRARAALLIAGTALGSQLLNVFGEATHLNAMVQSYWKPVNDLIVDAVEREKVEPQTPAYYIKQGMEDARRTPAPHFPADDFAYRV